MGVCETGISVARLAWARQGEQHHTFRVPCTPTMAFSQGLFPAETALSFHLPRIFMRSGYQTDKARAKELT
jgi:hypothetical protein